MITRPERDFTIYFAHVAVKAKRPTYTRKRRVFGSDTWVAVLFDRETRKKLASTVFRPCITE